MIMVVDTLQFTLYKTEVKSGKCEQNYLHGHIKNLDVTYLATDAHIFVL